MLNWGKWEVEIRMLVRRIFEMRANWIPVEGCKVCNFRPVGGVTKWHFPEFVLQSQQDDQGGLFDLATAVKRRMLHYYPNRIVSECLEGSQSLKSIFLLHTGVLFLQRVIGHYPSLDLPSCILHSIIGFKLDFFSL